MSDTIKFPVPSKSPPQLRYAVLQHDGVVPPHFDLLFETDPRAMLTTWRSGVWPILSVTPVTKIADHRREYLSYEGPVGGNRGTVSRVTSGYYRLERPIPATWRIAFRDYVGFVTLEFRRDDAPPKATPSGAMLSSEESWTVFPV